MGYAPLAATVIDSSSHSYFDDVTTRFSVNDVTAQMYSKDTNKQTNVCSLYKAQWLLCAQQSSLLRNHTFCRHIAFVCFVRFREQTAIISLFSFITEM